MGVVVPVRDGVFMLDPELGFDGERLPHLCRLESLPGPQGRRRAAGDRSATLGQTLSLKFREKALEGQTMIDVWPGGVQLICTENPPSAVSQDYPSVNVGRKEAGKELNRLASRGEVHRYGEGARPPDFRVRPSHVIVKEDTARVAHDWSNVLYPLNSVLVNPPAHYGATDEFLSLPTPGAVMGGIDMQDCFLHWLAAPSRRRPLGVRRPATGILGAYLFLPFGLGPPRGWNDARVKALPEVARSRFQRLGILDFAYDIRLVTTGGERDTLAADMTAVTSLLGDLGIRYHAAEGKRLRPTRCISWLRFEADAYRGAVRMEERKVSEGPRLRKEIFGASPGSEMSARTLLASASFLNFLHWVTPGGFCH